MIPVQFPVLNCVTARGVNGSREGYAIRLAACSLPLWERKFRPGETLFVSFYVFPSSKGLGSFFHRPKSRRQANVSGGSIKCNNLNNMQ